ncbi:hypothetical protein EAW52_10855 [Pseudomonas sp. LTJR-52]|uniref:hypothetical protein n=1 Tax=unclassified Pseudomonas TaxID=196821 RepID=UPI000EFBBECC|nr:MULTISPECIES: hypothetical protein [unclassified Pseudomonas]AYN94423.1 hypothetical protein EAW52_10855 [Pseudomonas sp. LTJR-52]
MSLKYQLDSLEGLDDSVRALYTERDGKFFLSIEGIPESSETEGLKRKLNEILNERKEEKRRREEAERLAEQERAAAEEEKARKSGDIEALQKSWEEKHTRVLTEKEQTLATLQAQIQALTVGSEANRLASELAVQGSSRALLPHIKSRLSMEIRDGKPVTVVLDHDGRPSALTLEELKNEFINDPAFAPLIVGSKATGGGAGGSRSGGAAKSFNQLTGMERVELRRTNPAEYERLKAQSAAH